MVTRTKNPSPPSRASRAKASASSQTASAPPPQPPTIDPEDYTFLQFLEGRRGTELLFDPLSDEGLRLQAVYVQNFSQHPMDILRRIMENVGADPKDRINAAKILLEYSQRKPTQAIQVAAQGLGLKLDANALANLSVDDLDLLEKLLAKAQGAK